MDFITLKNYFKSIFCEFQLEEIFSINSIHFKKEINLILTISREKYKIAENKNYHQSCSNRRFEIHEKIIVITFVSRALANQHIY